MGEQFRKKYRKPHWPSPPFPGCIYCNNCLLWLPCTQEALDLAREIFKQRTCWRSNTVCSHPIIDGVRRRWKCWRWWCFVVDQLSGCSRQCCHVHASAGTFLVPNKLNLNIAPHVSLIPAKRSISSSLSCASPYNFLLLVCRFRCFFGCSLVRLSWCVFRPPVCLCSHLFTNSKKYRCKEWAMYTERDSTCGT